MKKFLLLTLLISSFNLFAQNLPILPPDSILISSLKKYYDERQISELESYNFTIKKPWRFLLPTVGITYTLSGKPRPSASISSQSYFNFKDQNKRIAAKKKAIIFKSLLDYQDDQYILLAKIKLFNSKCKIYILDLEIFKINQKLWEIDKKKYDEFITKPSQFLSSMKKQLEDEKKLLIEFGQITQIYNDILVIARLPNLFVQ